MYPVFIAIVNHVAFPSFDAWSSTVIVEVQLPSGEWRTVPETHTDLPDEYRMDGKVVRDGVKVGTFKRALKTGRQGIEARHDALYIDESHRRKGFGKAYVTLNRAGYQELGVSSIRVDANLDGRLFNASLPGMCWSSRDVPARLLDMWGDPDEDDLFGEDGFRTRAAPNYTAAGIDEFVAWVRGGFPTPNEVAGHPLAKLFLLGSPNWQGHWPV